MTPADEALAEDAARVFKWIAQRFRENGAEQFTPEQAALACDMSILRAFQCFELLQQRGLLDPPKRTETN